MKYFLTIVGWIVALIFGFWLKGRFDEILVAKKQEDGIIKRFLNITFVITITTYIFSQIFSSFVRFTDDPSETLINLSIFMSVVNLIACLAYGVFQVLVIVCEDKSGVKVEGRSAKSRKIDTLLCTFLGFAGVHRFYEGKIGTGILWLLTLGLFGVGYFIDFIKVITGKSIDKEGNPILSWD